MTFVGLDEVTNDILVMLEWAVQIAILSNVKFALNIFTLLCSGITNLILNITLFLFLIHVLHLGILSKLYQILGMFQHHSGLHSLLKD